MEYQEQVEQNIGAGNVTDTVFVSCDGEKHFKSQSLKLWWKIAKAQKHEQKLEVTNALDFDAVIVANDIPERLQANLNA